MKKLLLLAILGLLLGGGVWKAQNPDGTVDDLKSQSLAVVDRFKVGVDAVINQPAVASDESSLDRRVAQLEERIADDEAAQTDDAVAGNTDEATENVADVQPLQGDANTDVQPVQNNESLAELQETLEQRVASMEAMSQAVAELDTAVVDTRARTDASNVRLNAIDRRLALLVQRLDEENPDDDVSQLSDTIEAVQDEISGIRTELNTRNSAITDELTGIRESSDDLSLRLETLVTSVNVADDNEGAAQVEGADEAENQSLLAISAGVDERLNGIEDKLSTVNSDSRRIAALNDELEATRARIAELEQQDAEAEALIQELSDSVGDLTTAGETLSIESIQTEIRDQLASVQSQFDDSTEDTDTAELESLLESTRSRIQTLEQRVQELPASSEEAGDAAETQSALQAQIADLTRRLESMTSADPALANTVDDVKQQVEELSAQGFVTREELQAQIDPEAVEYKIYFDRNSTDISDEAAVVLDSFITQEKNRTTGVSIFGFTDRSGSAAYNQQLALQRATNVRSYLIQNGLDFTKIKALSGLGEDAAAAVLPDDAFSPQQRVVVLYAAQP